MQTYERSEKIHAKLREEAKKKSKASKKDKGLAAKQKIHNTRASVQTTSPQIKPPQHDQKLLESADEGAAVTKH